jgi:hypothetical protein
MKEFIDGELDRLTDLQVEALREAAAGAPNSAAATVSEAEKIVATIEGLTGDGS